MFVDEKILFVGLSWMKVNLQCHTAFLARSRIIPDGQTLKGLISAFEFLISFQSTQGTAVLLQ
jgi:hypothetical protein